jgi:hypothetical protein
LMMGGGQRFWRLSDRDFALRLKGRSRMRICGSSQIWLKPTQASQRLDRRGLAA